MNPARRRLLLLSLPLGWIFALLVVPCALIIVYSFFERGVYGGIDWVFTFENYQRAADPLYLRILLKSLWIAALTTLLALLIAFPAAWFIAGSAPQRQKLLLVLAILPFWSNYLIRTYAWMVLLNREGLINNALEAIGVIDAPLALLYNDFAIVLGLLYAYLPFMILPLYAALSRLNREVLEASTDLGANAWRTLVRVVLPLTVPGIAAGSIFVFVYSMGNFITPDLMGGGRSIMVGNLIYDQFLSARDWPFGSALSFVLMGVMMALLSGQAFLLNRARRAGTDV